MPACQHCHEHVATAPRRDEVVDCGVLGNELEGVRIFV
jgi:hypothetical protein